jgi:Zn-dependent peptidase ImmA (M78 family)
LRAYADAPSKFVDRTIADSATLVQLARDVELAMLPDTLPTFDGDLNDDDAIEEFAQVVRSDSSIDASSVVGNVVRAAERLGCIVLPMDSELGRHLGMSLRVDDRPVIRVSRPTAGPHNPVPGDRQRFTVAHEIGHLVLHAGPPPPNATDANRAEKQAHRFASAFLAPAEPLLDDLADRGGRVTLNTLAELKEIWGVAIKALVVRFRQLDVIDDDQARSLYKQISARRWNTAEPVPVGNESAIWLSRALDRKLAGDSSVSRLASERSGLGVSYIERWVDWSPMDFSTSNVLDFDQSRTRASEDSESGARDIARLPARPRRN